MCIGGLKYGLDGGLKWDKNGGSMTLIPVT